MSKKRILKTLAMMAVMLSLAAAPALAQSELDQSQPNVDVLYYAGDSFKQTFTAQKTGTLDKLSVVLNCEVCRDNPEFQPMLTVKIGGTQSEPDPTVAEIVFSNYDSRYPVSLNPAPFVEAGKQYEMTISEEQVFSSYDFTVGGSTSDVYPGGAFYYRDVANWTAPNDFKDMAFQTYVTPDTTAPKVESVNPADGATGVGRSSKVTARFSEEVQAATLTSNSVQLFSGSSTKAIKATLTKTPTSVTLTPSQKLDAKIRYTAKIKGGSNGVLDLAGNPLASDFSWSFTTGSM